jgi:hypothetical protein
MDRGVFMNKKIFTKDSYSMAVELVLCGMSGSVKKEWLEMCKALKSRGMKLYIYPALNDHSCYSRSRYDVHIVMDPFMYKFKVVQQPYSSEPFNINSQIIMAVKKYLKSADERKEKILEGLEGNDKQTRRLIKLLKKKSTIIC